MKNITRREFIPLCGAILLAIASGCESNGDRKAQLEKEAKQAEKSLKHLKRPLQNGKGKEEISQHDAQLETFPAPPEGPQHWSEKVRKFVRELREEHEKAKKGK